MREGEEMFLHRAWTEDRFQTGELNLSRTPAAILDPFARVQFLGGSGPEPLAGADRGANNLQEGSGKNRGHSRKPRQQLSK